MRYQRNVPWAALLFGLFAHSQEPCRTADPGPACIQVKTKEAHLSIGESNNAAIPSRESSSVPPAQAGRSKLQAPVPLLGAAQRSSLSAGEYAAKVKGAASLLPAPAPGVASPPLPAISDKSATTGENRIAESGRENESTTARLPSKLAPARSALKSDNRVPDIVRGIVNTSDLAPNPVAEPSATREVVASKLPSPKSVLPGELVVYWKDSSHALIGRQILEREFHIKPFSQTSLDHLGGVLATIKLPNQREAHRIRTILLARFPDWQIDFNARYRPMGNSERSEFRPNRAYFSERIDLPINSESLSRVRIGIVDSGITLNAALNEANVSSRNFLGVTDRPADPEHGTAIVTLIAGNHASTHFIGAGAGARLFVASSMQSKGGEISTNTAMLVRSLDWLASENVQIINLSLGGPGDSVMAEAIAKLVRKNIVVVAAAGNSGPDSPPSYPAAYQGVIAVTASDAMDRVYPAANQGTYVGITAPGVDIWIPDAQGGHYVTGTSFSAAIVTGAIAMILAKAPNIESESVISQLCQNAKDLGAEGRDSVYGCGLIQVAKTIASVAQTRKLSR